MPPDNYQRITRERLERWFGPDYVKKSPKQRLENARRLRSLAHWWLAAAELDALVDVHQKIRGWPFPRISRLPDDPGCCIAVAIVEGKLPGLRGAVALPLRWRNDRAEHDRRLPGGLRQLAGKTVDQLSNWISRSLPSGSGPAWTLHFAVESAPDLSALQMQAESAWAALAAGLILAVEGIRPKPEVWTMAAFDESTGIGPIELGDQCEKLVTAHDFGAKKVFLAYQTHASWQTDSNGRTFATAHPQIEVLPLYGKAGGGKPDVLAVLKPVLEALRRQPSPQDEFEVRKRYYLNLGNRREARNYFFRCLLEDVVAGELHAAPSVTDRETGGHLVAVASGGLEVLAVLCGVYRPAQLWVWYDREFLPTLVGSKEEDDLRKEIRPALEQLRLQETQVHLLPIDGNSRKPLREGFRRFFGEQIGQAVREPVQVDLTLGTSLMSVCLNEAAPPESWMVYVQNETEPVTDRKFWSHIEQWKKY